LLACAAAFSLSGVRKPLFFKDDQQVPALPGVAREVRISENARLQRPHDGPVTGVKPERPEPA